MNRLILAVVVAGVALLTFLSLRACFQAVLPPQEYPPMNDVGNSVVAMADGSVMIAQPGTISRGVIDWFNDKKAPAKAFNIGWQPFAPNSAEPAADSQVRLQRFVIEMQANRDVAAKVIVCTAANDPASVSLAKLRAARLEQLLVASHIRPDRVSAATCRLPNAKRVAASPSTQDGEVIEVVLSR